MVEPIETAEPRFSFIDGGLGAARLSGVSYLPEDFGAKAIHRFDLLQVPANGNHSRPGLQARLDA
jgi:hypothetical protein